MITFLSILSALFVIATVISVVALYKMIVALNKKTDALQTAFNEPLKTLDDQMKVLYERVDKMDDRIPVIVQWCETLRENQDTLQGDMEKAFYGTKKEIRKVEKQQERVAAAEAQKSV